MALDHGDQVGCQVISLKNNNKFSVYELWQVQLISLD